MFGALSNVESKPNSHLRSKLDVWRCIVMSQWDDKDLLETVEGAGHSKLCFWGSKLSLLRLYSDASESRVCDLFLARNSRRSFCCFSRRNEPFYSVMLPKNFLSQHHSSFKVILGTLIIRLCETKWYVVIGVQSEWTWTQICRFSPKDVCTNETNYNQRPKKDYPGKTFLPSTVLKSQKKERKQFKADWESESAEKKLNIFSLAPQGFCTTENIIMNIYSSLVDMLTKMKDSVWISADMWALCTELIVRFQWGMLHVYVRGRTELM